MQTLTENVMVVIVGLNWKGASMESWRTRRLDGAFIHISIDVANVVRCNLESRWSLLIAVASIIVSISGDPFTIQLNQLI